MEIATQSIGGVVISIAFAKYLSIYCKKNKWKKRKSYLIGFCAALIPVAALNIYMLFHGREIEEILTFNLFGLVYSLIVGFTCSHPELDNQESSASYYKRRKEERAREREKKA
jgi:hypothetical protein